MWDKEAIQRPVIIKRDSNEALTEIQHCKGTEYFFGYKNIIDGKIKGKLIFIPDK